MGNDEDWEINIEKEEIDEFDKEYLAADDRGYWHSFSTRILLTELCNRGVISSGNYLISVSW